MKITNAVSKTLVMISKWNGGFQAKFVVGSISPTHGWLLGFVHHHSVHHPNFVRVRSPRTNPKFR